MNACRFIWLAALLSEQAYGATIVITNASVPEPISAAFSAVVPFRPGDGTVASVNPPRFSWSYTLAASNANTDITYKTFNFQCSTQSNFATLDVDVSTQDNFYNFLAAFTNSPIYWRVKYYTNGVQEGTSATRTFSFTGAITNWDRSMFADTNYLATNAVHPFIMLRAGNRLAQSNHIATNFYVRQDVFEFIWTNAIGSAGWPTNMPADHTPQLWSRAVGSVALAWQLNRSSFISNSFPGVALCSLATNFAGSVPTNGGIISNTTFKVYGGDITYNGSTVSNHYTFLGTNITNWSVLSGAPFVSSPEGVLNIEGDVITRNMRHYLDTLALGYDWLYDLLTLQQKTQVLAILDARCEWIVNGSGAFGAPNGQRGPDTLGTGGASHNKAGFSHDIENFNTAMVMALAGHQDGFAPLTNCLKMFQTGLNYWLGVTYCYGFEGGMNQGRDYSAIVQFLESSFAYRNLIYNTSLPRMDLEKNPWWQTNALWWSWMVPVGFKWGHGPWGDDAYGEFALTYGFQMMRDLTWITQTKRIYDHWTNEMAVVAADIERIYEFVRMPLFYHYQAERNIPTNSYVTNTAALFPEDGWAMASTYGSQDRRAVTNGVGIIFSARPRASEIGHSFQGDLSFQLWAYGAPITDAGAKGLADSAHVSQSHYTLMANGFGQAQPYLAPIVDGDYYSRFTAFTNHDGAVPFAYFAAQGFKSYPRTPFTVTGAEIPLGHIQSHNNAPLARLTNVTRHILMPRKKYFVIYDDLGATTNFIYSQLYHVLENTLVADTNAMRFSYSSTNSRVPTAGAVTTYVAHVTAAAGLSMVVLTTNNYAIYTNIFIPSQFATSASGYFGNGDATAPYVYRAHAIWTSSKTSVTNHHFLTVIYPVKPDVEGAPIITRINDFTVGVTNSALTEGDVIFFGAADDAPADATFIVGLNQTQNQSAANPPVPGGTTGTAVQGVGGFRFE